MLKIFFLLFLTLQTCWLADVSYLQQLMELFPKDKISKIIQDHMANDDNFRAGVQYLKSDEWKQLIDGARGNADWVAYKNLLAEDGVDIANLHQRVAANLKAFDAGAAVDATPSFKKFNDDLLSQNWAPVGTSTLGYSNTYVGTSMKSTRPKALLLLNKVLSAPGIQAVVQKLAELE